MDDVLLDNESNPFATQNSNPFGSTFDDLESNPTDFDDNHDFRPSQSLIAEPDKVTLTHINYAKKATNIDIEKLRASIWKELEARGDIVEEKISNPVSFNTMLNELPNSVPQHLLTGVSVPLCFICLLDLANKKQLQIDQTVQDLQISSYQ